MAEKKTLHLNFLDNVGKKSSIVITNPKDNITLAEVKPVGDLIASKAVLESAKGILTTFQGAELVSTKTEELV